MIKYIKKIKTRFIFLKNKMVAADKIVMDHLPFEPLTKCSLYLEAVTTFFLRTLNFFLSLLCV
jgi:hypothetical protein